MRSTRPESSMPLRMQLMVLIGFLALVGAIAMLVNGSSLRVGFVSGGSVIPTGDASVADSIATLVHLGVGKSKSTMYNPTIYKHASIAGRDQTRLVLKEEVHQSNPLYSDVSAYWGGGWVHVNSGSQKTQYVDLRKVTHITTGAKATEFVDPKSHISTGANTTSYDPTKGGSRVHVTNGVALVTAYVIPEQHIEAGEYASQFGYDGEGPQLHITMGAYTTVISRAAEHKSTGSDKTSLIIRTPTPAPAPTPPTQ